MSRTDLAPPSGVVLSFERPLPDPFDVGRPPVIRMDGITRSFDGVPVLRQVDLEVGRGEYVAIVGPSGSGKSTLLNVIGCLDRPTSGSYLLDGVETTALDEKGRAGVRAGKLGFVFQSFHLLPHLPIEDNVALAESYRHRHPGVDRRDRRERAIAQLQRVGLGHRIGYSPKLLSGGERQRVAIARALLGRPSLLLCDEPTGSLDTANTAAVLDLFDELQAHDNITLLVITHDPTVAARSARVVEINDGVLRPR